MKDVFVYPHYVHIKMHELCLIFIPKEVYEDPEADIKGHIEGTIEGHLEGLDWYIIGGRWNGFLIRDYVAPEVDYDLCYVDRLEDNCVRAEDLLNLYLDGYLECYPQMYTSDGQYHKFEAVGDEFLGLVKREKDSGNYVVNIDCHM
jgi:hypothetical protein